MTTNVVIRWPDTAIHYVDHTVIAKVTIDTAIHYVDHTDIAIHYAAIRTPNIDIKYAVIR